MDKEKMLERIASRQRRIEERVEMLDDDIASLIKDIQKIAQSGNGMEMVDELPVYVEELKKSFANKKELLMRWHTLAMIVAEDD